MRDEDDDQPTHEDIAEQFAWREGEREQAEREMAERQARIERDAVLAWCAQRAEARKSETSRTAAGPTDELGRSLDDPRYKLAPEVITKSYGAPAVAPAAALMSNIKRQLDQRDRAMRRAIAHVVVAEEKAREKVDAEITAKLDAITVRLDELAARLDKIEATPPKLKVAS